MITTVVSMQTRTRLVTPVGSQSIIPVCKWSFLPQCAESTSTLLIQINISEGTQGQQGYLEIVAIYFISQLALEGPPMEVSNNQNQYEFFS